MATDEAANGSGRIDPWKRERLLGVGAKVVLPDYRDAIALGSANGSLQWRIPRSCGVEPRHQLLQA